MSGLKPRVVVEASDLKSLKVGEQYWQHISKEDSETIERRMVGIRRDPHALLVVRDCWNGKQEAIVAYIPPNTHECLGFENYATAGLVLLLENEREDFGRICSQVRVFMRDSYPHQPEETKKILNAQEYAAQQLGESLKDQVEKTFKLGRVHNWAEAGLIVQHLHQVAVAEINWREVGEHFVARTIEGAA